jgi:hypothetical protein
MSKGQAVAALLEVVGPGKIVNRSPVISFRRGRRGASLDKRTPLFFLDNSLPSQYI